MKPVRGLVHSLLVAFENPRVRALLGFTFTIILCASLFYHYVEGWSLIDAAYFSVMTLATVGYGDLTPHTVPGKLFTIGFVLMGLGIFVATATALGESMLATRRSDLEQERERKP